MPAYAHSYPSLPREQWHRLEAHLETVSRLAADFAAGFQSAEWARLAGLWHDFGKYAASFQRKLIGENDPNAHIEQGRQAVDHSTAGALLAMERSRENGHPLAWVIAGHHAGLDDAVALFKERLPAKSALLAEARQGGAPAQLMVQDIPDAPGHIQGDRHAKEFWIRMLFSSLVDADFLDTENWFALADPSARGRRAVRNVRSPSLSDLRERLNAYLNRLHAHASATPINELRARVLKACRSAGVDSGLLPGHFSLTVPTGGGKTLSAVAFALEHALTHGLRRVITVIPFTSIIEQTAEVYRQAMGQDVVVEQHSALDPDQETFRTRVLAENWDAPIVVTTSVQFFESLLANRPARCRKLHNIAGSVVILDEVQSLPREHLEGLLSVMNELARHYRVSFVLCTATQPALHERPALPQGLENVREIVPPREKDTNFDLSRVRVRVEWPDRDAIAWGDLAARLKQETRVLAIVHLRDDARELTLELDRLLGDRSTIQLSALMYPAHRQRVLAEVKRAIKEGGPVRVVSTQLVEAGVDIDFPVVYRALAGADALAQAAGRCNREGGLDRGKFSIFLAPTLPPRGILRQGLGVMKEILAENPQPDLFDPRLYARYFERLYPLGDLDASNIQEARASFRFRDVAARFAMIPEQSTPVVIPLEEACRVALEEIRFDRMTRQTLRRLQRFTVSLYPKGLESLEGSGALEYLPDREHCVVRALRSDRLSLYDERLGLLGAVPSVALIA